MSLNEAIERCRSRGDVERIISAETRYRWDDGVGGIGSSAPDLFVEFGKKLPSFNPENCRTAEVMDSNTATWNQHCDFTFEIGDAFKIAMAWVAGIGIVYPYNAKFGWFDSYKVKYPMHYVPELLMIGLLGAGFVANRAE